MDINKIKSALQMKKFYFSSCSITRDEEIDDGEYNIDLQKNIKKLKEHTYEVSLKTIINKSDMKLEIEARAEFLLEIDDPSREEAIINTNTIAIMFPFVRSQVTLMTSQPGMAPIVLPPINTQNWQ